jgi:hypothetical protein
MTTTLSLSSPFQFSTEEACKSGFSLTGTSGCGKTVTAFHCVRQLQLAGALIIVFDPSQAWLKYPYIKSVTNFGQNLSSGAIEAGIHSIAVTDRVIDVSTLTTMQFQEVADKFCWLLFNMQARLPEGQRKQIFILFEEAHIVLPEGSMKSKRLQNVVRLVTVGRNYKIRVGVITQFAAMLDKSILRFAGQRYFGWTDEFNDLQRIATMIGKEQAETLKYYKTGDFFYYAPALGIEEKIHVQPFA